MSKGKREKGNKQIVIYQAKSGAIELWGDFEREDIWATQAEMARIFNVTPQNITLHMGHIFKEGELDEKATCKESLQVQKEGDREIRRKVKMYNLDAIIAVGYRVNSVVGTHFRQWATKTLREHITKGYTINRRQIAKNHKAFMKTVSEIQALLPEQVTLEPKPLLDLIKEFSNTWVSLDAYDRDDLKPIGKTKRSVKLSVEELISAIGTLKNELIRKKEATEIFAQERTKGNVEGIVGNVMQSFAGSDMYKTVEEKAAHLLYFMVKDHPFIDGNKRSGAFAFIWFLRKSKVKKAYNINSEALTALTLLIAESDSEDKERVVGLTTALLSGVKS